MAVFRYSAALLDWGQLELEELDRQTRQFLYKHNFLHPRSNIDRFYMSRSSGGRGFESAEDCVANERRNLDFYLANSEEELLKFVAEANKLDKNRMEGKQAYKAKARLQSERLERWKEMPQQGHFKTDGGSED